MINTKISYQRRPRHVTEHVWRPTTRPMYAAVFDLEKDHFANVCETVYEWMRSHPTVRNITNRKQSRWFSIDRTAEEGLVAKLAISNNEKIMAAKLIHREHGDETRSWHGQVTVERDNDAAWIAVRVWFTGLPGDRRPFRAPTFIRQLWKEEELSDVFVLSGRTWQITNSEAAQQVAELIQDNERNLPVVLVADDAPMDTNLLADGAIGNAHVCRVTEQGRAGLAEIMGLERSLRPMELRTYYAWQQKDITVPSLGSRPETIENWRYGKDSGPKAFAEWLKDETGRVTTERMLHDRAHRNYEEIRDNIETNDYNQELTINTFEENTPEVTNNVLK